METDGGHVHQVCRCDVSAPPVLVDAPPGCLCTTIIPTALEGIACRGPLRCLAGVGALDLETNLHHSAGEDVFDPVCACWTHS